MKNWKRRVSGILYDRRISLRVKGKVYKTVDKTSNNVRCRDVGSEESTREEVGCGGNEDVEMSFIVIIFGMQLTPIDSLYRVIRKLKAKARDPQQLELERKEQGFSLYVNGAHSEHSKKRSPPSGSRSAKTAGG